MDQCKEERPCLPSLPLPHNDFVAFPIACLIDGGLETYMLCRTFLTFRMICTEKSCYLNLSTWCTLFSNDYRIPNTSNFPCMVREGVSLIAVSKKLMTRGRETLLLRTRTRHRQGQPFLPSSPWDDRMTRLICKRVLFHICRRRYFIIYSAAFFRNFAPALSKHEALVMGKHGLGNWTDWRHPLRR